NSKASFNSSMAYRGIKFARRLMPGSLRKASSEPLRHVILQNRSGLRTSLLGPLLFASVPTHSDVTDDVADAVDPLAIPGSQAIASRTNRLDVTSHGVDVTRLNSCAARLSKEG